MKTNVWWYCIKCKKDLNPSNMRIGLCDKCKVGNP